MAAMNPTAETARDQIASARCATCASGFSLIELLTVLVVVGILASVAAPRLNFEEYAIRGAVQSVTSTLMRAQRQAVQQQHPVVVAFDAAGGTLRIHDDSNANLLIDGGERVRFEPIPEGVRLGRGSTPPLFGSQAGATFSTTQGGLPVVVFYRNGSASEEGGFYLTGAASASRAEVASPTRAARIQRSTGKPEWFRYSARGWERE